MFEFELPDVGEGVAEGEIVTWHVEPGDTVTEDEVLAEVETDKAVVDLPSPVAGTVVERHAEEGDVVPVGDVVITIDTGNEADETPTDDGESDRAAEEANAGDRTGDETDTGGGESAGTTSDTAAGGRVFAPPHVRRLARELGVDITAVDGSGPGGRVTEGDVRETAGAGGVDDETVEAAISEADVDADEGTETKSAIKRVGADDAGVGGGGSVEATDRDRTLAAPATRRLAREEGIDLDEVPTEKTRDGEAFVEPEDVRAYVDATAGETAGTSAEDVADTDESGGEAPTKAVTRAESGGDEPTGTASATREPYRGVRRTIGEKMEESVYSAPHVTHHDTAVVPELVETRERLRAHAAERGVELTYLPFVLKAVVAALREHPVLNSELDEEAEEIVYKHEYHIGVAVATDAGLMVPVVEDVDEMGLLELAETVTDLAARARSRDLDPAEMRGGTFSVTNFGAIGGEYATPIINYPETAILGLGRLERRPVVEDDGVEHGDTAGADVVARHTLPLSLSIDHRVIDGAQAAQFVNTLKEYLEDPSLLLLE